MSLTPSHNPIAPSRVLHRFGLPVPAGVSHNTASPRPCLRERAFGCRCPPPTGSGANRAHGCSKVRDAVDRVTCTARRRPCEPASAKACVVLPWASQPGPRSRPSRTPPAGWVAAVAPDSFRPDIGRGWQREESEACESFREKKNPHRQPSPPRVAASCYYGCRWLCHG